MPLDGAGDLELERPSGGLRRILPLALLALASAALAFFLLGQSTEIYDSDSYYHLAVARAYAGEGIIDDLRWARYSVMAGGFGDKELLFHLLLVPFVAVAEHWVEGGDLLPVVRSGQLALALLVAALATTIAALARPLLGRWALILPWLLIWTSMLLFWRLVRLRPEVLAVLLLLLALAAIVQGRYRTLGLLAFLFTLSYTAFHALLGLSGIVFAWLALQRRRFEPALLLYPLLGCGLGLIVHPHFPDNLSVWWLQSFDFFAERNQLDVGSEIRPNTTDVLLLANLGWWVLLGVLWRSATPDQNLARESERWSRAADVFGIAAVIFSVLYLLMSRFALYAVPLVTLWLLFELARRGLRPGGVVCLPGGRRLPWLAAVVATLALALPAAWREAARWSERTAPGPDHARYRDREAVAAVLPAAAKVAAPWQQTGLYMLWAPHARYLNVLDPIFMARPYPEHERLQRAIFTGVEPDAPALVATALDSRFIAYPAASPTGDLGARLAADPRVTLRHRASNLVWEITGAPPETFVVDWRLVGAEVDPQTLDAETLATLSRLESPLGEELSSLRGYVDLADQSAGADLSAVPAEGCVAVATLVDSRHRRYELAPWGRTEVWLDGTRTLAFHGTPGAVLGRGLELTVSSEAVSSEAVSNEAAARVVLVATCSAPGADGVRRRGFYLRPLISNQ